MRPGFKFLLALLIFLFVFSACSPLPPTTPLPITPSSTDTPSSTETNTPLPATEAPAPAITSLQMLDASSGWGWSSTGHLLRTTDGGRTWSDRTPAGYQISPYGGGFLDFQTAWLPVFLQDSNRSGLLHTSDGGQTWVEYPQGPASGLHFTDVLHGWAISGDVGAGNVYFSLSQTSDGGKTWAPIPVNPPNPEPGLPPGTVHLCNICNDTFYYDPTRLVIGYGDMGSMQSGGAVRLKISFDLGRTWQNQALPLPQAESDALVVPDPPTFFDGQNGLLPVHLIKMNQDGSTAYQRMAFYSTRDGGVNWSLLPGILDSVRMYTPIQVISARDIFVLCNNALCASHDGAHTWQTLVSNLDFTQTDTHSVAALDFINASTGWAIVQESETFQLYKTTDGGVTWNLLTPRLAAATPVTVTIDTSIPTPTLVPTPAPELSPTPDVAFDPQADADRIRFAPSATWVEINGSISADTPKRFVLAAMQGQVMSVSILQGPPFSVQVTGADKKSLSSLQSSRPFWRGVLPSTQDYFVTVNSQVSGPFFLRIAINPPGQTTQNFAFYDSKYVVALGYTDEFAPTNVQVPAASTKGTSLLTLSFIDPTFYQPTTNLSEAYLLLTASTDPAIVSTCTQPSTQVTEAVTGQETVSGYTFTYNESTGEAAGNIYDQISYRTVWQDKCFEVIFLIHSTNIGNYPPGTVVEFDKNTLLQKFAAVLATFIAK